MDRQADRPGLVGDRAGRGLADPPGRIGRELVAPAVLELLHGAHQPRVALLDQVEQLQPAVLHVLHHRDDQAQIRLDDAPSRGLRPATRLLQLGKGRAEVRRVHPEGRLIARQPRAVRLCPGPLRRERAVGQVDLLLGLVAERLQRPLAEVQLPEAALQTGARLGAAQGGAQLRQFRQVLLATAAERIGDQMVEAFGLRLQTVQCLAVQVLRESEAVEDPATRLLRGLDRAEQSRLLRLLQQIRPCHLAHVGAERVLVHARRARAGVRIVGLDLSGHQHLAQLGIDRLLRGFPHLTSPLIYSVMSRVQIWDSRSKGIRGRPPVAYRGIRENFLTGGKGRG